MIEKSNYIKHALYQFFQSGAALLRMVFIINPFLLLVLSVLLKNFHKKPSVFFQIKWKCANIIRPFLKQLNIHFT